MTFNEGTGRGSSRTIVETFDSLSPFSSKWDEEEDALFLTRVEKRRCMVTVGAGEGRMCTSFIYEATTISSVPGWDGPCGEYDYDKVRSMSWGCANGIVDANAVRVVKVSHKDQC